MGKTFSFAYILNTLDLFDLILCFEEQVQSIALGVLLFDQVFYFHPFSFNVYLSYYLHV